MTSPGSSGSTGISPEEFERFQHQLLELREERYQLKEQKFQADRQIKEMMEKLTQQDREIKLANETIGRSKKAREIDLVVRENEALRDRLTGIESNFLLQIDTLRAECQTLLSENERLQCQLETYKSMSKGLTPAASAASVDPGNWEDENGSNGGNSSSGGINLQLEITKLCEEKAVLEERLNAKCAAFVALEADNHELAERVSTLLAECAAAKRDAVAELDISRSHIEQERGEREAAVSALQVELAQLRERSARDAEAASEEAAAKLAVERNAVAADAARLAAEWEERLAALRLELVALEAEKIEAIAAVDVRAALDLEAAAELARDELEAERRLTRELREEAEMAADRREKEVKSSRDKLQYATEELKSMKRKHQHQMKDLRRQLEKEVRRGEEIQAAMAAKTSGSATCTLDVYGQLSQNGGGGESGMGPSAPADDASSVYSATLSGVDGGGGSAGSSVIEADLKSVIDRLTGTQEENCELKRQMSRLEGELTGLHDSLHRKDAIIEKYIRARGVQPSSSSPASTTASPSSPSAPPLQSHTPSGTAPPPQPLAKLMDSLKRISVTQRNVAGSIEVRQLQNMCEELMTRTMHLEEDLKLAVDENVTLKERLLTTDSGAKATAT